MRRRRPEVNSELAQRPLFAFGLLFADQRIQAGVERLIDGKLMRRELAGGILGQEEPGFGPGLDVLEAAPLVARLQLRSAIAIP